MKSKFGALKEELNRIKSLFTEERMFGNLVEQGEEETEKGGIGFEREKVGEKSAQSKGSTWKPIDDKKDLDIPKWKDNDEPGGLKYLGLELDRIDTINDKAKCRKHLDTMIKLTQKGMKGEDLNAIQKNGEDYLDRVNWCVNRFSNEFEKEGFLKKGSKIRIMMDTLGLEMTAEMKKKMGDEQVVDTEGTYDENKGEYGVDTGIEGEKYDVKNEKGNIIGVIKKTDDNRYRFRSKKGYPILDKSDKGNPKFRDEYIKYFYKAINVDPTKYRLKIQKSFEKDKLDMGTFVLVNL